LQKTADKSDPDLQRQQPPTTPPADKTTPPATPDPGKQPDPKVSTPDPKVIDAPPTDKAAKTNPWHLVESYKKRVAAAETEILELKKQVTPEQLAAQKDLQTKYEQREARLKELEEEIRYVDYTKSEEFKTKYHEPYVAAWNRAMGELRELTIDAGDGSQRQFTTQDMLRLVNLPIKEAKQLATAMDPDFANELMQHRSEIKRLSDDQAAALKKVREEGDSRVKERRASQEKFQNEVTDFVKKNWQSNSESIVKHERYGKYFQEVEGDEELNTKLKKGFEVANAAFTETPLDPRLTPEQRATVIKKHVALMHRAAAFGALVTRLERAETKLSEQTKDLAKYKQSTPPDGGGTSTPTTPNTPGSARARMHAELEKLGKPA
jgi:hypothetical protein